MTIERALPDEDLVVNACPRCSGRVFQPWGGWEPYCLNCGWQDYLLTLVATRGSAYPFGYESRFAMVSRTHATCGQLSGCIVSFGPPRRPGQLRSSPAFVSELAHVAQRRIRYRHHGQRDRSDQGSSSYDIDEHNGGRERSRTA